MTSLTTMSTINCVQYRIEDIGKILLTIIVHYNRTDLMSFGFDSVVDNTVM